MFKVAPCNPNLLDFALSLIPKEKETKRIQMLTQTFVYNDHAFLSFEYSTDDHLVNNEWVIADCVYMYFIMTQLRNTRSCRLSAIGHCLQIDRIYLQNWLK
jgi:hypothetical protein